MQVFSWRYQVNIVFEARQNNRDLALLSEENVKLLRKRFQFL